MRPRAVDDLERIYDYIHNVTLDAEVAQKVREKLLTVAMGLAFMPNTRPAILDANTNRNYRKAICGEYIIPFIVYEDVKTVLVTRVFHGKSNYQKYL